MTVIIEFPFVHLHNHSMIHIRFSSAINLHHILKNTFFVKQLQNKEEDKDALAAKAKEEAIALREAMAKQLPKFPPNYDLTQSEATHGGDFTHFYRFACGEEMALLPQQDSKGANNGTNGSTVTDNDWMDEDVGESEGTQSKKKKAKNTKKKAKNNHGNGADNNRNSKNKGANGAAPSASTPTSNPIFSLAETEQLLHSLNNQTIIDLTIRLSGYHSPPPHRRILGDLAYIEAIMPGSATIHITAFSLGFYVNKTNATGFDPTPAAEPYYSHSLLDCLLLKSKSLREAWSIALQASHKRAELLKQAALSEDAFAQLYRPAVSHWWNNHSGTALGSGVAVPAPSSFSSRLDSVTLRPSWLVPLPMLGNKRLDTWRDHSSLHKWNVARSEEELTSTYGMDIRGGGIRDWNEELQAARDMGVETLEQRIERARMIHKVLSDFSDAALQGIHAIFDGYITPMNPNEPARSHVYLHNNIFFSRAVDAGLDTFKIIQGDRAARKSASREAANVGVIHRLDVPGLYTLGTVLVEYLGTRFVCQSVVPGILHGEKAHTLTYGAVEALSELQCDAEMHKVLEESLGEECMVATRSILSKPLSDERMEAIRQFKSTLALPTNAAIEESESQVDAEVKANNVCGPVEMKGILGSDKRKYVLDCTRLTPRDANWVAKANGGTGYWEAAASLLGENSKTSRLIPATLEDDEWTASILRPELVTSYADEKLKQFLLIRQAKEAETSSIVVTNGVSETSSDQDPVPADANEKEKDWVDVETSGKGTTEEAKKEEEEFIQSLRYNVNVFLPYMKSIENANQDAHAQLQKDEEEARQIASYLWNTVLPDVTKELRLANGSVIQIPVDGKSLTEFLHKRGINCRYLGRLADLAKVEEQNDVEAEKVYEKNKKEAKLPRFRMPLCWLELLECEIVARAAKHVLDFYLTDNGGTAAIQPAQTIASFLSAVISTSEETASETELRISASKGDAIDTDDINSLTLFDVGGKGDAVHKPVRGRSEIWSDIEKEIGRRFRYTLSLYNNNAARGRALYAPLLRRICQRSGIRIAAKAYDVGRKCVCGGGSNSGGRLDYSYPIAAVDIIDVLPLVKHAASSGEESFTPCLFNASASPSLHIVLADAKAISDAAHRHLNNGNISIASEYAQEAASLYQRVAESPLHLQIAKCINLLSKCHFYGQDHDMAILSSLKNLAVSVSLGGFDCMETVSAHSQLSDAYFAAGKVKEGMKHVRAVQFLMEFLAGANYSQLSSMYYKVGTQYFECEKLVEALSFYEVAQMKRSDDRMVDGIISSSAAMALAHLGKFNEASSKEKIAYQLYQALLGEDHDRTKISSGSLLQFMRLAMEQGKIAAAQKNKISKEKEANAVAQSIKAEEDRAESSTKKKKKKKKGKATSPEDVSENIPEKTLQAV
eukprot:CCRYP_017280-RB/>CCRYP_017280-RB protein AED:0.02 eAED:0.02 QI:1062/1/1/1/1/1/4/164/1406